MPHPGYACLRCRPGEDSIQDRAMDKITLQLPTGAYVVIVVAGLVTTFAVKYFAPALAWWQALLVSLVSAGASLLFLITYIFLSGTLGFPELIDSLAFVVTFAIMGTLITWQAQAYGVEKTGFVGVGGRSVLALLALSVAAIAIHHVVKGL